MSKKKHKGHSRASIEAEKKKSLSDIGKTRRKLQAIEGREQENIKLSTKDRINLNKATYDLNKNKLLIEDTHRGTPGQKASIWSRRSIQNRSKFG